MRKIIIYGSSDDCVEVEGDFYEEYNVWNAPCWIRAQVPSGAGLMVYVHYAPEGTPGPLWVVGMSQLGEDQPLPDWPMHYRTAENGYSPALCIEAPDDVELTEV